MEDVVLPKKNAAAMVPLAGNASMHAYEQHMKYRMACAQHFLREMHTACYEMLLNPSYSL